MEQHPLMHVPETRGENLDEICSHLIRHLSDTFCVDDTAVEAVSTPSKQPKMGTVHVVVKMCVTLGFSI